MRSGTRISKHLLGLIILPSLVCLVLAVLVFAAFDVALGVAADAQERNVRRIVSLSGGTIERLWLSPRNRTVATMAGTTLRGLQDILGDIPLPAGGVAFLLDRNGRPFAGTDERYAAGRDLPQADGSLFVEKSAPLSNGWRLAVVVPRRSLTEHFARLRNRISRVSELSADTLAAHLVSVGSLRGKTGDELTTHGKRTDCTDS